jgi:hypothetical protein
MCVYVYEQWLTVSRTVWYPSAALSTSSYLCSIYVYIYVVMYVVYMYVVYMYVVYMYGGVGGRGGRGGRGRGGYIHTHTDT